MSPPVGPDDAVTGVAAEIGDGARDRAGDGRGPAVEVRGLRVAHGSRPALERVDLRVAQGERLGVIGPNGAGKSTLLRAIVGLVRPRAGTVRIQGVPATGARGRVAYLAQRQQFDVGYPARVRDVVTMGRYPHRGPLGRLRAADRRAVDRAIEQVGLADLDRVRISELSGGQQQRAFLARALAQEAAVLLLDEPYAGLDAATASVIDRELARAATAGVAVVVVNHDLAGLRERYDRLLVLRRTAIALGPVDRVLTAEVLDAAYGPGAVVLTDGHGGGR